MVQSDHSSHRSHTAQLQTSGPDMAQNTMKEAGKESLAEKGGGVSQWEKDIQAKPR